MAGRQVVSQLIPWGARQFELPGAPFRVPEQSLSREQGRVGVFLLTSSPRTRTLTRLCSYTPVNSKQARRFRVWPAVISGAPEQIRTADTRFRRAVLYPLSYEGL